MLDTNVSYLKGVGPAKADILAKEFDILTYGDLLHYFPFRMVDRSRVSTIDHFDPNEPYLVFRGRIGNLHTITSGRTSRLEATFSDGTGTMTLVWFQGLKWIHDMLRPNTIYNVMGKPSLFGSTLQMAHPDIEASSLYDQGPAHAFLPIYRTTEKAKNRGINTKAIARFTATLLPLIPQQLPETLPNSILAKYHLMGRGSALRNMHYPDTLDIWQQAIFREKFEELFYHQLEYQYSRLTRNLHSVGRVFGVVGDHFNDFYNHNLPFPLTGAQKRVIKEIRADMRSGRQMNRLLQGDVGSGKTLVALLTILIALDNGCQACLMAPTEILATQHFANFQKMLAGLNITVELLIGSLKASQKKKIKQRLADGSIDILIGTHALIEPDVQFSQLGYVVIDEQHRFGVEQRSKLWNKSSIPPHVLVMTATPIPRTLAMTLYADLDCSVIDELPPGRRPVITTHGTDAKRLLLFHFMKQEIAKGRQVYVVYPLINESESMDLKDLMDGYESISRSFPQPEYQLSIVHGQMPAEAKAYEMDRFKRGETHIMVSTTVIEVGVDVPNATVMVIENAERFGLSQLHQLRGRVGRGGTQSYCILMTKDDLSHNSKQRIQTMCSTTDGFAIAEADLRLRGPGDLQGLQQSGMLDLKLADIVDDEPLVRVTRDEVHNLLSLDPDLQLPDHAPLRQYIINHNDYPRWDKIS
ncbi:MAG: ATP-dependent DNA helicase RecG [Bacteroidales bacterium]|nr:ATP-dependent DNA helicase RecG [Bacteroidales bacterium]